MKNYEVYLKIYLCISLNIKNSLIYKLKINYIYIIYHVHVYITSYLYNIFILVVNNQIT